jgi:hypothetical protein
MADQQRRGCGLRVAGDGGLRNFALQEVLPKMPRLHHSWRPNYSSSSGSGDRAKKGRSCLDSLRGVAESRDAQPSIRLTVGRVPVYECASVRLGRAGEVFFHPRPPVQGQIVTKVGSNHRDGWCCTIRSLVRRAIRTRDHALRGLETGEVRAEGRGKVE